MKERRKHAEREIGREGGAVYRSDLLGIGRIKSILFSTPQQVPYPSKLLSPCTTEEWITPPGFNDLSCSKCKWICKCFFSIIPSEKVRVRHISRTNTLRVLSIHQRGLWSHCDHLDCPKSPLNLWESANQWLSIEQPFLTHAVWPVQKMCPELNLTILPLSTS